jgi:hypothetical protein
MSLSERKLWRAVLEQAYEDAELRSIDGEAGTEPFASVRARRYLRAESPFEDKNLKLVCEFADVPADRVVLWARQHYPVEQAIAGALQQLDCNSVSLSLLQTEN